MVDPIAEKAVSMLHLYGPRKLAEIFLDNASSLSQRMLRHPCYGEQRSLAIRRMAEMAETMTLTEVSKETGWSIAAVRSMLAEVGVKACRNNIFGELRTCEPVTVKIIPPTPADNAMNRLLMRKWA